jgi:hypothetical protein
MRDFSPRAVIFGCYKINPMVSGSLAARKLIGNYAYNYLRSVANDEVIVPNQLRLGIGVGVSALG